MAFAQHPRGDSIAPLDYKLVENPRMNQQHLCPCEKSHTITVASIIPVTSDPTVFVPDWFNKLLTGRNTQDIQVTCDSFKSPPGSVIPPTDTLVVMWQTLLIDMDGLCPEEIKSCTDMSSIYLTLGGLA